MSQATNVWRSVPLPSVGQVQHQPQDQESKVDTLHRMSNDPEPGTAKASAWKRKDSSNHDTAENIPWLMKMIETKQECIDQPIRFPKDPRHARQKAVKTSF